MDLNRTDIYDDMNIPDADVETALKVIRTIRAVCMDQTFVDFNADCVIVMTHAHARIIDLCEMVGAGVAYPDVDTPIEVTL